MIYIITLAMKVGKNITSPDEQFRIAAVQDKDVRLDYQDEENMGLILVPGETLISSWAPQYVPQEHYYLIIDDLSYEVNESLYDNVKEGDQVKMVYTADGKTLLSIIPVDL